MQVVRPPCDGRAVQAPALSPPRDQEARSDPDAQRLSGLLTFVQLVLSVEAERWSLQYAGTVVRRA